MDQSKKMSLPLATKPLKHYTKCPDCGRVIAIHNTLSWIEKMFFGGKLMTCPQCKGLISVIFQRADPTAELYAQLFKTIEDCPKKK
jgi:formate dehydrogenase maturation protein FdhE